MNRRARARTSGIQLFPFLAVLICTMGALVVLLHAFARHGQIEGLKAARAKAEAQKVDVDDYQWRIAHLREARAKTEAQLADERLKLAHVEDHQRRLREALRQLTIAGVELERAGEEKVDQRRQTAADMEAVKAELAETKAALEAASRKGPYQSVSYSVIPYHGRNATDRRPIYIECRENLIVLQPEGIEMTPRDFVGNFGPGNPLAVALRAQREYFARQTPAGQAPEEPYPLLLVRPEGTAAYYAARAALDSWGTDFGYELVGSDWELKFPDPDPQLARLLRQVVAEARLRHREYALTSPQAAKQRSRPVYRALAHGGVAEVGPGGRPGLGASGAGGWDGFAGDWATGGELGDGDDPYDSDGGTSAVASGGKSSLQDPYGDAPYGPSGEGSGAGGDARRDQGESGAASSAAAPTAIDSRHSADAEKGPGGHAPSGQAQSQAAGDSNTGGEQNSAGGGQPNSSSASASGSPASQHISAGASHKPQSMATMRGTNWGLPESGVGEVAATRPILVECYPDRLVILPESRGRPPKEIRLAARTEDTMDELASAVWDHMQGWGKAGKGLYWRPTLSMDVKPGAAERYTQIQALLSDSGLDVHQRQRPATARPATTRPNRR